MDEDCDKDDNDEKGRDVGDDNGTDQLGHREQPRPAALGPTRLLVSSQGEVDREPDRVVEWKAVQQQVVFVGR